jgi:DNA-binding YbaB/EbfC family protein
MGNILKQAKKAQAQIAKIQEELSNKKVEASSGGGMVIVQANGRGEILSIRIEKEVIDPSDPEMLQDLIVAAVNEALRKAQEMMQEEMGKLTQGLGINIPGLF